MVNLPGPRTAPAADGGKAPLRGRRALTDRLPGEAAGLLGTSVHAVALPALAVLEPKAGPEQVAALLARARGRREGALTWRKALRLKDRVPAPGQDGPLTGRATPEIRRVSVLREEAGLWSSCRRAGWWTATRPSLLSAFASPPQGA